MYNYISVDDESPPTMSGSVSEGEAADIDYQEDTEEVDLQQETLLDSRDVVEFAPGNNIFYEKQSEITTSSHLQAKESPHSRSF